MITDIKEPPTHLQERESNSTTLEQCGWCEYASGSHRYNYCIKGSCSLSKSYSKDVIWSDKCKFIDASQTDIDAIVKNHEGTIKQNDRSTERQKEYIKILSGIREKAVFRPPLPDDRKHDHFNLNEPLRVYYENKWQTGEVKEGYRHHDGCVSYRMDDIGPQEKGFWGNGYAIPTVLLENEYQFFKENTKEYLKWCEIAYNKDFNGERMNIALIN